MKKNKHGGPRPNSGRKPDPNRKLARSYKLDREIVAYLMTCDNATAEIEQAIRRRKRFREWKRGNDTD